MDHKDFRMIGMLRGGRMNEQLAELPGERYLPGRRQRTLVFEEHDGMRGERLPDLVYLLV